MPIGIEHNIICIILPLLLLLSPSWGPCYCSLANGADIAFGYATLPQSPAVLNATAPFPRTGLLGHLLDTVLSSLAGPQHSLMVYYGSVNQSSEPGFFVICAINVPPADIGDTYMLN